MSKQSLTKNINLSEIDFNNKEQVHVLIEKIIEEMGRENKTLEEVIGLNPAFTERVYSYAYTDYNAGKYSEALQLFDFLVSISPRTYKYLLGAASCLYQKKEYRAAAVMFFNAMHIEPKNPYPVYYFAECCLKDNHLELAESLLEHAIEISADRPEFTSLHERCLLIKKSIKL